MCTERVLVIGVGNPLMRDEGAGPRAVELLMAGYEFPDNVEVVDAGTMGLSILDLLVGIDRMIVIDALTETGHPAGTVLVLKPEDVERNQVMHSLHDMRISDVLENAALIGRAPETVIVGIQIDGIDQWVLELSEPVETALPVALAAVLDELKRIGVEPTPREGSNVHAQIIEALRTYAPMPEAQPGSPDGD